MVIKHHFEITVLPQRIVQVHRPTAGHHKNMCDVLIDEIVGDNITDFFHATLSLIFMMLRSIDYALSIFSFCHSRAGGKRFFRFSEH
jgi:hypothetical protein